MTRHHLALVATVTVAGSVLSGCGSSPAPVSTPTPTVVTTSASPKPTHTAKPLSPFEGRAPVKAVRTFFDLAAKAINRREHNLASLRPTLTPNGMATIAHLLRADFGLHYPGPVPFTPTRVDVNGHTANVYGCMWGLGFAIDPKTGKPAAKRTILPARIPLVGHGDRWRLDQLYGAPGLNCHGVAVRGQRW